MILSAEIPSGLRNSLLLHAPFDGTADAAYARGDKRIYSAPDYKTQDQAQLGFGKLDVEMAPKQGVRGDALRFKSVNAGALFFKAPKNVAYKDGGWAGTASFWLKLDPDNDLKGFADPIQFTDKAYNDAAIWVDFTKDDRPRHFRLGVFGNLAAWNPTDIPPDKNPNFTKRLVVLQKTPFSSARWTNVTVTWTGLGGKSGSAQLYVDAKLIGNATGIEEAFNWDPAKASIRLGVNYAGLMDELTVFDRPLTAAEVGSLYNATK